MIFSKDPDENIIQRIKLMEAAKNDKQLQREIINECRDSIIYFFSGWCWTYDPRLEVPEIPFILYPKQESLVMKLDECLKRSTTITESHPTGEKISLLMDKPRAVGATCTIVGWFVHKYLFHSMDGRLGSRKEDYVDKRGETDTLFYKIEYILDRLPLWMKGEIMRTSMMIKKVGSDNQISGESSNPNFSRGGRKTAILFDEMAFWDTPKSSWESSGESTNLRIAISTPPETGKDSHFYKLLAGKKGRVERFDFDWKDVPGRNEVWYKEQQETKSEAEFAREVNKSYDGTTEGKVYAKSLRLSNISDEVDYNPRLPLFCSWDFGLDAVAIIWLQKDFKTDEVFVLDSHWSSDKEIDYYIPFIKGDVASGIHEYDEYELDKIDLHKKWSKTITHYGDPDVKKRNLVTKTSVKMELNKHGVYVQSKSWSKENTWKDHRDKTQMLMRRLHINESRNEYLLSCLRSARYPERRETSQATTAVTMPIHDWTSHFRTALEYFADNEPKADKTIKKKSTVKRVVFDQRTGKQLN